MKQISTFLLLFLTTLSFSQDLALSATTSDSYCYSICDGTITASATGGSGTYMYSLEQYGETLVEFQSTSIFINLCAGDYVVSVMDSESAVSEITMTILEPAPLMSAVEITDTTNGSDGVIEIVETTGGVAPYVYSIDTMGTYQVSPVFTGLAAGSYQVSTVDANGCIYQEFITLTEPLNLSATILTSIFCSDLCDGSIEATATGGSGDYEYGLSQGGGQPGQFQSSGVFNDLCAGNFTAYVRDSNLNISEVQIVLEQPTPIVVDFTTTSSGTAASGTLTINASGGNPSYLYSIDNSNYQTLNVFTDLAAGTYNVSTIDINGCEIITPITITSSIVTTTVTVSGNDLTADANALSYQWINADTNAIIPGETNPTFTATESGNYRVEMTIDDGTTVKAFNSKGKQAIITISSPTYTINLLSVDANELKKLKVYPNPASNNLILPVAAVNKDYIIYSVLGKKVSFGKLANKELSVIHLKRGLYYLVIEDMNIAKFIKQ